MNDRIWFVYKHINKINGKIYIGITREKKPENRWKNGLGYKHSSHLWSAIQKYGWNNFDHEVIASGLTEQEACCMEIDLIKKYKSNNNQFGYNIAEGGSAPKWTEESKLKNSGANNYLSIPVTIDGIVFESITDCAKYLDMCRTTLLLWLNGKSRVPKDIINRGLNFVNNPVVFRAQKENLTKEERDRRLYVGERLRQLRKQIKNGKRQINHIFFDGCVYSSISSLSRFLKCDSSNIAKMLRGDRNMSDFFKNGGLRKITRDEFILICEKEIIQLENEKEASRDSLE